MRFSAVLFDLDGTLLDTLEDIADACNAVLASLGRPTHATANYKQFVGEGVRRLFEKALPEGSRDAQAIETCAARFADEYGRRWKQKTRPYAGIDELLAALRRAGLPLAVLSNKPQEFTEKSVAHFFPAGTFACVLGQRDGVPRKPDPAAAWEIAAKLGLPPERIAYLGDSPIDMETAVRAGMHPIGAVWGFRSREELLSNGAAALVSHPRELLPLVLGN